MNKKKFFKLNGFDSEKNFGKTNNSEPVKNGTKNIKKELSGNIWKKKKNSYLYNFPKAKFSINSLSFNSWGWVLAVVLFVTTTLMFFQLQKVNKDLKEINKQSLSLINDLSAVLQDQETNNLQTQEFFKDLNKIKEYLFLPTATPNSALFPNISPTSETQPQLTETVTVTIVPV